LRKVEDGFAKQLVVPVVVKIGVEIPIDQSHERIHSRLLTKIVNVCRQGVETESRDPVETSANRELSAARFSSSAGALLGKIEDGQAGSGSRHFAKGGRYAELGWFVRRPI
jgi:hypothetical protein